MIKESVSFGVSVLKVDALGEQAASDSDAELRYNLARQGLLERALEVIMQTADIERKKKLVSLSFGAMCVFNALRGGSESVLPATSSLTAPASTSPLCAPSESGVFRVLVESGGSWVQLGADEEQQVEADSVPQGWAQGDAQGEAQGYGQGGASDEPPPLTSLHEVRTGGEE